MSSSSSLSPSVFFPSETSSSSLLLPHEVQILTRRYPHFSPSHLMKLSQWFLSLSPAYSSPSFSSSSSHSSLHSPRSPHLSSQSSSAPPPVLIELNHLLNILHSSSLLANKKDFLLDSQHFHASIEGLLTFDEFLEALTFNIAQKRIVLKKLIRFLDEEKRNMEHLSSNLILTMNRRKLLMEHVINRSIIRGIGLDHAVLPAMSSLSSPSSVTSAPNLIKQSTARNLKSQSSVGVSSQILRRQQSLEELAELHSMQRKEASEVIVDLNDGIQRERELLCAGHRRNRKYETKSRTSEKKLEDVLIPLEELITSSKLLPSLLGEEYKELIDPEALRVLTQESSRNFSSSEGVEAFPSQKTQSGPTLLPSAQLEIKTPEAASVLSQEVVPLPFTEVDWIKAVSKATPRQSVSALPQVSPPSRLMSRPSSPPFTVDAKMTSPVSTPSSKGKSPSKLMKADAAHQKSPPPPRLKLFQKSASESHLGGNHDASHQTTRISSLQTSPISATHRPHSLIPSSSSPGSDAGSDMSPSPSLMGLSLGPLDGINPVEQYTPVSDRSYSTLGSASASPSQRKLNFAPSVLPSSVSKAAEEHILRCTPFVVKPLSPSLQRYPAVKTSSQRPYTTSPTSRSSPVAWRR